MVEVVRSQPDDGAILVIEPPSLLVPLRELKTFFTPKTLNLLMVHTPTFHPQQLGDLPIAVPTILLSQADHRQAQGFLALVLSFGLILLCGPCHIHHTTCTPFRRCKLLTSMNNGLTQQIRRQALGFKKSRLSLRISLSNSSSAKIAAQKINKM